MPPGARNPRAATARAPQSLSLALTIHVHRILHIDDTATVTSLTYCTMTFKGDMQRYITKFMESGF